MTAWWAASSISTVSTIQPTETRRGRPACGKAYFRPVFRDREGGSCVSAHRSRLLGRVWGACLRFLARGGSPISGLCAEISSLRLFRRASLRRQKSRSRRQVRETLLLRLLEGPFL